MPASGQPQQWTTEGAMNLSEGERLIIVMLCDIYKSLNLKGAIDPEFVRSSILSGQFNQLKRLLESGGNEERNNGAAEEVGRILEMWSSIERGYKRLTCEEKDQVEAEAGPLGRGVRFSGFDIDSETEHHQAAYFLIEETDSFERFRGRKIHADMPTLDGYRRMLRLFDLMQPATRDGKLGLRQIIELANAEKYPG
jgi:uncharacterized protein YfbU (UPF0304 family)